MDKELFKLWICIFIPLLLLAIVGKLFPILFVGFAIVLLIGIISFLFALLIIVFRSWNE